MRCAPSCGRCPPFSFVPAGTKCRLQDRTYHRHVVYKCALAKSKGMGSVPYPCVALALLVLVCAVLLFAYRGACVWLSTWLFGQSVQYAVAVFGEDSLFQKGLKLLVRQRDAFGQHTFKKPHALAEAFCSVFSLLLFFLLD